MTEPIILFGGDQIEGPVFRQLPLMPLDEEFLKQHRAIEYMLLNWTQLYEGRFPDWMPPHDYPHDRLRPKPSLDGNGRVTHHPLTDITQKNPRGERGR